MNSKIRRYFTFLCVCLFTSEISASLKEALEEHLKDIAHNDNSESIQLAKEKAEKNHHVDSEIKDSHANQYSKENDDLKFLTKDQESKSSSDKDSFGGYNTKQDKAQDSHTSGYKIGHKKGHHKQGFQNSYHKDESSNKSTYFDDSNDEVDRAGYNNKVNNYDNNGGRSYEGSHNRGQEYLRNNYRGGGHSRFGDISDKHINHQDSGNKYYLDNMEHYNRNGNDHGAYERGKIQDRYEHQAPVVHHNPGWDWQEKGKDWDQSKWEQNPGSGWERDYSRPGYYDDHGIRHSGGYGSGPNHGYGYRYGESRSDPVADIPRPVVARRKQTITIYEDPRYNNQEKSQLRREEGDYIELDYQPSSRRYASYDDTYYSRSAPAQERSRAEASEINKLVYN